MDEPTKPPSLFELEFQAFVERGGLDQDPRTVVSEDYERSREVILCKHRRVIRECVICYKPLKPYMPGDNK